LSRIGHRVPTQLPSGRPTNLPTPLTSLVGREQEVAQVATLLRRADVRLITLTGPGGVGKTRLALRVTEEVGDGFSDGVQFIPLASITDPDLVLGTVARTLGVREARNISLVDRLKSVLAREQLLLVLDNVEQVVEAAPQLVEILAACPQVKILATSRVRLRVTGEREYVVPPLGLAALLDNAASELVLASDAMRLFVERSQAVKSDFTLTAENKATVAAICRRVDGLPLAIELAAARIKVLPPAALLARLEQRLPLLTGGSRDLPTRQRTMRDAIAWSHDLLDPDEQALFRRLGIFVGGFDLEAAQAVCAAPQDLNLDLFEGVSSLVDKSLLRQETGPGEEPRFTMLETIREYALERLAASGEADAGRQAHAAWYLEVAVADVPPPMGWIDSVRLGCLAAEQGNFRAALDWFATCRDPESLARLARTLNWFWQVAGQQREARVWLNKAMSVSAETSPEARLGLLAAGASLAAQQGEHQQATALAQELLALARAHGDRPAETVAGIFLSRSANQREDYAEATALAQEFVALCRELGDTPMLPWALQRLGIEKHIAGDYPSAVALIEESLEVFRAAGNQIGVAYALSNLGLTRHFMGDSRAAVALYRESLALPGNVRDPWETAALLSQLAALAAEAGHVEPAARLLGAATGIYETTGTAPQPYFSTHVNRAVATARSRLGEQDYETTHAAGRRIPLKTMLHEALVFAAALEAELDNGAIEEPATSHGLSPREIEVLQQIAAGRSNAEIADALFISARTASTHVSHLYAKLGVASRAEAVAFALRNGII
jgi:predicted ATPase/DNA-binding CsgD family transcriptional regulator